MQELRVGSSSGAHHDLAEQPEGEVRVVPLLAGTEDELGVLEASDQLLTGGRLHRLPDLARRLALQAGQVTEGHPHRRADRGLGNGRTERRVQLDPPFLDELHHEDRRERLRDRADAIDIVGCRNPLARDIGDAENALPDDLAVTEDTRLHRRQAALRLRGREQEVELGG